MSLSRKTFTKEFKEAAVRRIEMGVSLAEVARVCEVDANVLRVGADDPGTWQAEGRCPCLA